MNGTDAKSLFETWETEETEFPVVIRPQPLRLDDIEWRVCHDPGLVAHLRGRPSFCTVLAAAVLVRDRRARSRFRDVSALASYLRALVVG